MLLNRNKKTALAALLAILMLFGMASSALAVSAGDIRSKTDLTLSYYNQQSSYDDWQGLGLRWLGSEVAPKMAASSTTTASDYARLLMGQIAANRPAAAINATIATLQGMQNPSGDFNTAGAASLNQTIWAVIALNFAAKNGYTVSYDETDAAAYIAAQQNAGGGFDESGWGFDVDSTAHALIALSSHQADYPQAIQSALTYLKSQQDSSGGFQSWGSVSPDSTAAVIEALMVLGCDPQSPPGTGWKGNMVEALLSYQLNSGGFYYPGVPDTANSYTTRNALLALGDLAQNKSKYLNALPATGSLALTITNNGKLHPDSDASVTIRVNNASGSNIDFLLIAALYEKANEKMEVYNSVSQSIAALGVINAEYGLSLPAAGNYELRIYAWNNWTDRTPLASVTIIPIE
ncbi:MAG: prenyltransferase/squalene oxidase repeat-containing protein [Deltaproteobacteria bacterium]